MLVPTQRNEDVGHPKSVWSWTTTSLVLTGVISLAEWYFCATRCADLSLPGALLISAERVTTRTSTRTANEYDCCWIARRYIDRLYLSMSWLLNLFILEALYLLSRMGVLSGSSGSDLATGKVAHGNPALFYSGGL